MSKSPRSRRKAGARWPSVSTAVTGSLPSAGGNGYVLPSAGTRSVRWKATEKRSPTAMASSRNATSATALLALRVQLGDELLVRGREVVVLVRALAVLEQAAIEVVEHDRIPVEPGRVYLRLRVALEDVEVDVLLRPEVGRARE